MDICSNKHKGNPQSIVANQKVPKAVDRNIILDYLYQYKTGYSKQISRYMNKGLNRISGRLSELKAEGKIIETGEVIEGCAVFKLNKGG